MVGVLEDAGRCPACQLLLNGFRAADGTALAPKPGDVTICLRCGSVLLYDDRLHVRFPTRKEMREVIADPQALAAIERASTIIGRPRRGH